MKKQLIAVVAAMTLTISASAGSALAHYCTPADKAAGAGVAAEYNIITGEETIVSPSGKPVGGFITITDGENFAVDVFQHTLLPDKALNAGPGDSECDGKGVDNALACFGV